VTFDVLAIRRAPVTNCFSSGTESLANLQQEDRAQKRKISQIYRRKTTRPILSLPQISVKPSIAKRLTREREKKRKEKHTDQAGRVRKK